jgi:polyphosphate kinase
MGSCRYDYSRAKDEMFVHTDTSWAPWYVVEADDKRKARLNCIAHLLSRIPYEDTTPSRSRSPSDSLTRATSGHHATSIRTRPRPSH